MEHKVTQDQDPEKISVHHLEEDTHNAVEDDDDDRSPEARGRNADQFDKNYWRSWRFLGSMLAIGLGFCGGTGGYALIAPVTPQINADLGPSPNIAWLGLAYLVGEAVFFLLVGRLSDVFGRRWFFITGSLLGVLGAIVGATAQTVNTLIGAEILLGISAAFQISFFWVISELVPMRWRYAANTYAYIMTIPTNPLAAKIAFKFQLTSAKWRASFYFMIGVNALSATCWYLFYHPPTFKMLHRRKAVKDLLTTFDWIGLAMYTGSLTILIMGLNWGGNLYAWRDPHVIGTVIVGGIFLFFIFPFYEWSLQRRGREPFLPLHLFKNLKYQSCSWLTAIGAAVYYGFSLIWPQAVQTLYPGLSYDRIGTLAGLVAMGFVFGQMLGGVVATFFGARASIIGPMWIAGPLLCACAANPLNMELTMGLITSGALFIGMAEAQAATTSTFSIRTQEEIGVAGGLSGTIRSFGSVIATAVYSATLTNRLGQTIPQYVNSAVEKAGLPTTSIPALIAGLQGTGNLTSLAVPGLTPAINATAATAFRVAHSEAYKTVFLVSFAFSGTGMILCWFVTNNDQSMEQYVAGHVHKREDEKFLEKEDVAAKD